MIYDSENITEVFVSNKWHWRGPRITLGDGNCTQHIKVDQFWVKSQNFKFIWSLHSPNYNGCLAIIEGTYIEYTIYIKINFLNAQRKVKNLDMTAFQINDTFRFQSGVKYIVGKLWISPSIWHQAIEIWRILQAVRIFRTRWNRNVLLIWDLVILHIK